MAGPFVKILKQVFVNGFQVFEIETTFGTIAELDSGLYALAELGATAFTIVPGFYTGNPNPTLDERRADMENFASEIISVAKSA